MSPSSQSFSTSHESSLKNNQSLELGSKARASPPSHLPCSIWLHHVSHALPSNLPGLISLAHTCKLHPPSGNGTCCSFRVAPPGPSSLISNGISLEKPFLIIPSKVDPPWTSTSPCSMTLSGFATVPVSQCSYGLFLCGLLAASSFHCGVSSMRDSFTGWTWPEPGL